MEFGGYIPNYMIPSTITPQSGLGGAGEDKCVCFTIGNSAVSYHPTLASQTSMGDKVSSFRVLLKKFTVFVPSSRAGLIRTNFSVQSMVVDSVPAAPTIAVDYYLPDLVGIVASVYGMWGGGVRIKDVLALGSFTTPGAAITSNMVSAVLAPIDNANYFRPFAGTNGLVGTPLQHQTVLQQVFNNNTLVVEIPQYTPTIQRSILDVTTTQESSVSPLASTNQSATGYTVSINTPLGLGAPVANGFSDAHTIFRALADDGNFSVFISVPPMLMTTGTGNTSFF